MTLSELRPRVRGSSTLRSRVQPARQRTGSTGGLRNASSGHRDTRDHGFAKRRLFTPFVVRRNTLAKYATAWALVPVAVVGRAQRGSVTSRWDAGPSTLSAVLEPIRQNSASDFWNRWRSSGTSTG